MTSRLETFPKPIIAAVNGLAYGGGCEITEAVPLAIASDSATFAKPEVALGMTPTFGGTQRLPRVAGRKRALERLLTGGPLTAATALDLGLVNRIVPQADLMEAAWDMAQRILRHSPLAIAAILAAVTRGLDTSVGEGLKIESERFTRIATTRDLHEGLAAWVSRRSPRYSGTWTVPSAAIQA